MVIFVDCDSCSFSTREKCLSRLNQRYELEVVSDRKAKMDCRFCNSEIEIQTTEDEIIELIANNEY